jgi:hypothetical protein
VRVKMDAYDISEIMKKMWAEIVPKNSGELSKTTRDIKVCVWTDQGYREVIGLHYNPTAKFIELELDNE